jgi:two-component system, OmpR family, KDP operon response regulator KdpE
MSDADVEKTTVLVIEDEAQIRRLLRLCLEKSGYEVIEAVTGEDGIAQAVQYQPDLVLLDLRLPDVDGQEVLKRLREWSQVPVVVVSVRGRDQDKITALDNGANDYVTKPFSTGELLARLRAALRRAQPLVKTEVFRSGHLSVDLVARAVTVTGRFVKLTATEYALLKLFVENAGKVLTYGHILREIWPSRETEGTGPLRVYITYLREKLETDPTKPELLITEPGVGYRLALKD